MPEHLNNDATMGNEYAVTTEVSNKNIPDLFLLFGPGTGTSVEGSGVAYNSMVTVASYVR